MNLLVSAESNYMIIANWDKGMSMFLQNDLVHHSEMASKFDWGRCSRNETPHEKMRITPENASIQIERRMTAFAIKASLNQPTNLRFKCSTLRNNCTTILFEKRYLLILIKHKHDLWFFIYLIIWIVWFQNAQNIK